MASQAAARKAEFRIASAGTRAEQSGFERPALKIPAGFSLFNAKAQAYTIDICPYVVGKNIVKFPRKTFAKAGDLYYERTYFAHPRIGANQDSYACLAATFNEACPPCEHRMALAKDPKSDQKEKKALWPQERQLFYVRVDEIAESLVVPLIWDMAEFNFGRQLDSKIKNARPEIKQKIINFFDPRGGFRLRIVGEETPMGDGGKFTKFSVDEFIPRPKGLDPKFWQKLPPLEDCINPLDYKSLRKIFLMITDEDESGGGEEAGTNGDGGTETADAGADSGGGWGDETPAADAEALAIEVGTKVSFEYRNETFEGNVIAINEDKGLARVEVEGKPQPATVKLDELTVVTEEPEQDTSDDGWGGAPEGAADDGWGGSGDAEPAAAETPADDGWGGADAAPADDGWGTAEANEPAPKTAPKGKGGKPPAKGGKKK